MKPALFSFHRRTLLRRSFPQIAAFLLFIGVFSLNAVIGAPDGKEARSATAAADSKAKQDKAAQKDVPKKEAASRPDAKAKAKAKAKEGIEEGKAANLESRSFEVSPSFFSTMNASIPGTATDPFAPDNSATRGTLSPKKLLEKLGVTFGQGADARYDLKKYELTVVNTVDQLDLVEIYVNMTFQRDREKQIHILVEYIEVEHAWFSGWLFENRLDTDGTPLRNALQELVIEGDATIIESSMVTARSGQRAKTESVLEYMYPTEYDPSELPEEVELSDRAEAPVTAVSPTAFETRNVGSTLEVDPVIGADNTTIDLNLAPEMVAHDGYTTWPNEELDPKFQLRMPDFYTMRFSTQVTITDGNYSLLGTVRPKQASQRGVEDPIIIGFVRADIGTVPLAKPRR